MDEFAISKILDSTIPIDKEKILESTLPIDKDKRRNASSDDSPSRRRKNPDLELFDEVEESAADQTSHQIDELA
jgi:hypothetical protein